MKDKNKLHPSRFPKRADGTRFEITRETSLTWDVEAAGLLLCVCPTERWAKMVAAALEFHARDGETFDAEERK